MKGRKTMRRPFTAGTIVQHFKRETLSEHEKDTTSKYLYEIVGTATHTETGEKLMVYKALYESRVMHVRKGQMFTRPLDMFMSEVDHEKYPDIKQKYRFVRDTNK